MIKGFSALMALLTAERTAAASLGSVVVIPDVTLLDCA